MGKTLNIAPRWSPDGRSIAYTSYRRGGANIFISNIFQGTLEEVTKGDKVGENWLPAWSPDGTRLAFSSTRDGNPEIYVVNRDGSNLLRITNHPNIDITPTWSPSGTQIAFTSDRTGTPQIYVVGADGLNLTKRTSDGYCDRPTWSPAPFNEIASSRTGSGGTIVGSDTGSGGAGGCDGAVPPGTGGGAGRATGGVFLPQPTAAITDTTAIRSAICRAAFIVDSPVIWTSPAFRCCRSG